jgi:hypothetical protein
MALHERRTITPDLLLTTPETDRSEIRSCGPVIKNRPTHVVETPSVGLDGSDTSSMEVVPVHLTDSDGRCQVEVAA